MGLIDLDTGTKAHIKALAMTAQTRATLFAKSFKSVDGYNPSPLNPSSQRTVDRAVAFMYQNASPSSLLLNESLLNGTHSLTVDMYHSLQLDGASLTLRSLAWLIKEDDPGEDGLGIPINQDQHDDAQVRGSFGCGAFGHGLQNGTIKCSRIQLIIGFVLELYTRQSSWHGLDNSGCNKCSLLGKIVVTAQQPAMVTASN